MRKYKIQFVSKDVYQVVKFTEDEDEVFLEVLYKGSLHLCEGFLSDLGNQFDKVETAQ